MRLYELEQQPRGRPEIFLDMDGVLADFFSEYAKLAGVPANERGRHDYHKIPAKLREPVIQQMVGTDFFYRLPKFPSADRLVAMAVRVFGSYNICSSPLRGDYENSEAMKTAWIKENLNPQPNRIIITPQKGKYAKQPDGTPNILVDDRNTVLTEWEQSGGIGIKYQADENGLDTVARGLRRAFEILKGRREHTPQNIQSKDYGKMIAGPQDKINELKRNDYYRGDNDDNLIPWADALAAIKQFAENSLAIDFQELDGGRTAMTTWGPEFTYPYASFTMFLSPHGDGEMYGMLMGMYEDGKFDVIKDFKVPCSMNGVDYAARVYMQVRG